jgi:hypothetical protein
MNRWAKNGVLDRVFEQLQWEQIVRIRIEAFSLDSTSVKIHPDGTGALKTTRTVSFANNRSEQQLLCCNAFISVMKAAKLWNCDNLSNAHRLSRERTLLGEA